MENNKICSKCGTSNKNDSAFCMNCGNKLDANANINENVQNNPVQTQDIVYAQKEEAEGNKFATAALILYFAGGLMASILSRYLPERIGNFLSGFSGFVPLVGIVIMIVGRIKYPNNKLLKITMWVIISLFILGVIIAILFFVFCYTVISSAGGF